jgi:ferredoxin--NADP+ reductase
VRILCQTPEELAATDISDDALAALRESRVREVYLLGRRGPAQAAFTNPEIRELGELPGADVTARAEEVELDALSRAELEKSGDRGTAKKVEILREYARRAPSGKPRRLIIRFLVSPVALHGDESGGVAGLRLVHNELSATAAGTLQARATDRFEELSVGLVFRSVGYRGVPIPGVPFHDAWGVILNDKGRVLEPDSREPQVGEYAAGWIKRGPSGSSARTSRRGRPSPHGGGRGRGGRARRVDALPPGTVRRQPWICSRLAVIDAPRSSGAGAAGLSRVKFTRVEEMSRAGSLSLPRRLAGIPGGRRTGSPYGCSR